MLSVQHYCCFHTQGIGCDRNKIKTLILLPQTLNENISIPIKSDPEGTEYESRTNQHTR